MTMHNIAIKRTDGSTLQLVLNDDEMGALRGAVTGAPTCTCQCWHCRIAHAPGWRNEKTAACPWLAMSHER